MSCTVWLWPKPPVICPCQCLPGLRILSTLEQLFPNSAAVFVQPDRQTPRGSLTGAQPGQGYIGGNAQNLNPLGNFRCMSNVHLRGVLRCETRRSACKNKLHNVRAACLRNVRAELFHQCEIPWTRGKSSTTEIPDSICPQRCCKSGK